MRNLKKILALVLALIMSLSLMATAGATDFKDDESIDTYQTAIEVLSGLKVFGGDQNGNFNPNDPIRRSEVAAIIYRIATGDVTNDHSASYGLYNQFKDVQDGDWFAGYVSYCHNAGYIKGHGDSTFAPYDNVTGYQALAMILRAVGYDKNNEFTGDNWQINTASIATQRGVLKGLQSTEDLKAAASRELVAEILFRSILLNKVEWNALTHSYTETKEQVCKVLGLEEVEGVVMANEYANLEGSKVTAADTTKFMVNGETTSRTLNIGTEITDIGESRLAYIQGNTVFVLDDSGKNNVKSNEGAKKTLTQVREGIALNAGTTEYFRNFDDTEADKSEWIIRYVIHAGYTRGTGSSTTYVDAGWYNNSAYAEWVNYLTQNSKNYSSTDYALKRTSVRRASVEQVNFQNDPTKPLTFMVTIQPETVINSIDQDIMQHIFYTANATVNGAGDANRNEQVGEVYVGTTREEDKSDVMSWNRFVEEYIQTRKIKDISGADNGQWLKVIDNDNDNIADYVLWTQFHMDQVVGKYTKSGTEYLEYNHVDVSSDYTARYIDEVDTGDVVLYTLIDGQALISKAEYEEATIKTVTYRATDVDSTTATDTDGNVYTQSGIHADVVTMDSQLRTIDKGIAFRLYKDAFGYIRHYEPVDGIKYGLLTELYYGTWRNGRYVVSSDLTVELTAGDAPTAEYNVTNPAYNDFLLSFNNNAASQPDNWTTLNAVMNAAKAAATTGYEKNYINNLYIKGETSETTDRLVLQPAIANLGTDSLASRDAFANNPENNSIIGNTPRVENGIFLNARTNVARYIMTDGGVRLIAADDDTNVEYLELQPGTDGKIAAGQKLFRYASRYNYNQSVDATNNTEFYIVADNGISYFKGYSKLPEVKVPINAVYAVAHTTSSDKAEGAYYVADVIVIEAPTYSTKKAGLGLVYNNDSQTDRVRAAIGDKNMLALYTGNPSIVQSFIPDDWSWGNQYDRGYGFYDFFNTTTDEDGIMTAGRVQPIDPKTTYASNGIIAGTVEEVREINKHGGYIVIDKSGVEIDENGANEFDDWATIGMNDSNTFAILSEYAGNGTIENDTRVNKLRNYGKSQDAFEEQLQVHYNNQAYTGDVKMGDRVIWVTGPTGFAIDLDYTLTENGRTYVAPYWLQNLYYDIIAEQNRTTPTNTVNFFGLTEPSEANNTFRVSYKDAYSWVNGAGKDKNVLTVTGSYELLKAGATATTTCDKVEFSKDGATYYLTLKKGTADEVRYTLIQEAPVRGFANLTSSNRTILDVVQNSVKATLATQGEAFIRMPNRDILVSNIKAANLFVTDETWCTVTDVVGCDANGTPNINLTAATCDHILVTLTNDEGSTQTVKVKVLGPDEEPVVSYKLDVDEHVTTYLYKNDMDVNLGENTPWTENTIGTYDMQGYGLLFVADCPGTITVTGVDSEGVALTPAYPDSAVIKSYANGSAPSGSLNFKGVPTGVACVVIPAITEHIQVTFTPTPGLTPTHGALNLELYKGGRTHSELGYAWMEKDGSDIIVTVADASKLPDESERNAAMTLKWFGLNEDGTVAGNSTSTITGALVTEKLEDAGTYACGYKVTAKGSNGGSDASVNVYFQVYEEAAYIVDFWGIGPRNNIQFQLHKVDSDTGALIALSADELKALGVTSISVKVDNTTVTKNSTDTITTYANDEHKAAANGQAFGAGELTRGGGKVGAFVFYAGEDDKTANNGQLIPNNTVKSQYTEDGWWTPDTTNNTPVEIHLFAGSDEIKLVEMKGVLNV